MRGDSSMGYLFLSGVFHHCWGTARWPSVASTFVIYTDKLIRRLKSSKFGCCLKAVYYGCLVYADDVLLLSQSVQVMQNMVDICESHAVDFDVKFNCVKSVAMRIGPRHN